MGKGELRGGMVGATATMIGSFTCSRRNAPDGTLINWGDQDPKLYDGEVRGRPGRGKIKICRDHENNLNGDILEGGSWCEWTTKAADAAELKAEKDHIDLERAEAQAAQEANAQRSAEAKRVADEQVAAAAEARRAAHSQQHPRDGE
jgi:hypothetical protein